MSVGWAKRQMLPFSEDTTLVSSRGMMSETFPFKGRERERAGDYMMDDASPIHNRF